MKRAGERSFIHEGANVVNPKSMEIKLGDRISRHERHASSFFLSRSLPKPWNAKLTFPNPRIKIQGGVEAPLTKPSGQH